MPKLWIWADGGFGLFHWGTDKFIFEPVWEQLVGEITLLYESLLELTIVGNETPLIVRFKVSDLCELPEICPENEHVIVCDWACSRFTAKNPKLNTVSDESISFFILFATTIYLK